MVNDERRTLQRSRPSASDGRPASESKPKTRGCGGTHEIGGSDVRLLDGCKDFQAAGGWRDGGRGIRAHQALAVRTSFLDTRSATAAGGFSSTPAEAQPGSEFECAEASNCGAQLAQRPSAKHLRGSRRTLHHFGDVDQRMALQESQFQHLPMVRR